MRKKTERIKSTNFTTGKKRKTRVDWRSGERG
jgi:hypothetical protein